MDSSNKPSDKCFFSSVKTDETQRDRVKVKQDLLGQVSRLQKREEQIPPMEWVGPEVR